MALFEALAWKITWWWWTSSSSSYNGFKSCHTWPHR